MALSEAYSGTNASWGTEFSLTNASTILAAKAEEGIYQCFLDLNALLTATSDAYTFRIYEKVRSADAQRKVVEFALPVGTQVTPNWAFPAMHLKHGWDMTLQCTAGTNTRTITWSIRKIA